MVMPVLSLFVVSVVVVEEGLAERIMLLEGVGHMEVYIYRCNHLSRITPHTMSL
jgi:hypothetical protein